MSAPIVQSLEPITLIGGGDVGAGDLDLALAHAPVLVAADGGAETALMAGRMPVAVIGDFDSLSGRARAQIPKARLFAIHEQDSTDFDKALHHLKSPLVLGVGFLGARLDHQLAAFNTMVRRSATPCILIGSQEVIFHAPPRLSLDLLAGDIVSLFPMARVTGRSRGLQWPIDGIELAPDGKVGTSNRALGLVRLETDAPGLLVIVPRKRLGVVMRAFLPD